MARRFFFLKILLLLSLLFPSGCQKSKDCETLLQQYKDLDDVGNVIGFPAAPIAMGVASFFLPGIGSLLVGGATAAAAAAFKAEAENMRIRRKECLKKQYLEEEKEKNKNKKQSNEDEVNDLDL